MITKLLIGMINIYQRFFSILLGSNCRFYPSCSQYLKEAIRLHGPIEGFLIGITRLSKCHPWHQGGLDPVPDPASQPDPES